MKLERIKCKPLERAKNLCVSQSYIIGCTGRKAAIMDKQLNLIHTVEGLEYVYSAEVSPDERKLLLVSNGNKFYVVDMRTFDKTRITVKAPFNHNLEGRGCFSFDGKSVWIPVQRGTGYVNSTLRRYCIHDFNKYEDFLADKYYLNGITRIDSNNTYFLTGYNRQEDNKIYFIYFNGAAFREVPLKTSDNMIAPTATVDMEKGIVTLASIAGCWQFTLDGKTVNTITHPSPKDKTIHASDLFMHLFDGDAEKQKHLKEVSASLGLENISAPDYITKYESSSCGKYIYVASESGFYLIDESTGNIIASVSEEYGVQNFEELAPGMIAIATWSGVKLYRFCD
ncbi:MAG: hypothetical protein J6K03_07530 [Oscillospiraceae bacterium]|nr:hypothetical protein [Oscillospiraceae bacterium]